MAYPWSSAGQLDAADLNEIAQTAVTSVTAGEALSAGNAVCLRTIQSDGGIKYDSGGTGNASGTNGTVNNISITVGSNSNRILVVTVATGNSNGAFSITFNGVGPTSTLVNGASVFGSLGQWVYLWN